MRSRFIDHFTLGEQRPDHLVELGNRVQKAIDRADNLEANIENVDWHEFDEFYLQLEKAREESLKLQRAYIRAELEWRAKESG